MRGRFHWSVACTALVAGSLAAQTRAQSQPTACTYSYQVPQCLQEGGENCAQNQDYCGSPTDYCNITTAGIGLQSSQCSPVGHVRRTKAPRGCGIRAVSSPARLPDVLDSSLSFSSFQKKKKKKKKKIKEGAMRDRETK